MTLTRSIARSPTAAESSESFTENIIHTGYSLRGFRVMRVDRQTDRQANRHIHHNILHRSRVGSDKNLLFYRVQPNSSCEFHSSTENKNIFW